MKYCLSVIVIMFCGSVYADANAIDCTSDNNLPQISIVTAVGVAQNRDGYIQVRQKFDPEQLKELSDFSGNCNLFVMNTDVEELATNTPSNKIASKDDDSRHNKMGENIPSDYRVKFAFDRSDINEKEQSILNKVAAELLGNNMKVKLVGHTDNIGTEHYNIELGYLRANSVKEYLVDQGLNKKKVQIDSRGFDFPIESNLTQEGRAENRRVEINMY